MSLLRFRSFIYILLVYNKPFVKAWHLDLYRALEDGPSNSTLLPSTPSPPQHTKVLCQGSRAPQQPTQQVLGVKSSIRLTLPGDGDGNRMLVGSKAEVTHQV